MSDMTGQSEDRLMSLLRKGLGQADPAPSDVTEFAKAAFSWRDIDAELAELAYDSSEETTPSGVRSTATARMLSFEAGNWSIDIEYSPVSERLIGQIEPARQVEVELHIAGGTIVTQTDELGRFDFDGVLPGPISLVFRTPGNLEVIKTEWTVL
ncbi:MAG TPA: carboxypeptidase-like regulatory domain-containing protein [Acidimicrobiia bacterium]